MNGLYKKLICIDYICPCLPVQTQSNTLPPTVSPLFYSPTSVGNVFPNSFKLVTLCTSYLHTFVGPLSALLRNTAHHSLHYFSGSNVLLRVKPCLVYGWRSACGYGALIPRMLTWLAACTGGTVELAHQGCAVSQAFTYGESSSVADVHR